ncbi:MAG: hypothetical protein HUJ74_04045 [Lachnospiraceae bacterium]|nr:hypothetical protein [Lachnospiraceae bacterium]
MYVKQADEGQAVIFGLLLHNKVNLRHFSQFVQARKAMGMLRGDVVIWEIVENKGKPVRE